jgi:hypothetical protein
MAWRRGWRVDQPQAGAALGSRAGGVSASPEPAPTTNFVRVGAGEKLDQVPAVSANIAIFTGPISSGPS